MTERPYNVLFLCTGNSARSIMAEAILNREGHGRFRAYSAGGEPKGEVNPRALQLLDKLNYDVSHFRSKSWERRGRVLSRLPRPSDVGPFGHRRPGAASPPTSSSANAGHLSPNASGSIRSIKCRD